MVRPRADGAASGAPVTAKIGLGTFEVTQLRRVPEHATGAAAMAQAGLQGPAAGDRVLGVVESGTGRAADAAEVLAVV